MSVIRPSRHSLALALALLACAAPATRAWAVGPNDVGAWSAGHLPTWPTPPSARYGACTAYDPVRHQLIVFGGTNGSVFSNETWARTLVPALATWTQVAAGGPAPPARVSATMVYDPAGDRMIVFGGVGSAGLLDDAWALSLAGTPTWTALAPAGAPPAARYTHAAVFDPPRDRMIVFGGATASGPANDCWSLDLGGATPAWTPLAPLGTPPVARTGASAIDDAAGDAMVVFGGTGSLSGEIPHTLNDTWTLSLAGAPTWVEASPGGTLPPPRRAHGAAYDPTRRRMVVFEGLLQGGPTSDAWSLDLASMTWSSVLAPGPPPSARSDLGAIYDAEHDQFVLYGGHAGAQVFNDGGILGGTLATAWQPLNDAFAARSEAGMSFDAIGRRLVLIDGYQNSPLGDAWELPVDGDHVWTRLKAQGTPPVPRDAFAQIYDPVRRRLVVFGGVAATFPPGVLNDVWQLDLDGTPTWSALSTAGTPPSPRYYSSAAYDSRHRQMLVFGGITGGGQGTNEVWALSLDGAPTWTHLSTGGTFPPGERNGATVFYDPKRDRMIVYGGRFGFQGSYGDLWEFVFAPGGTHWNQLTPFGTPPTPRDGATAIYDPVRDRMVMYGGFAGYDDQNTWTLFLGAPLPTWTPFAPPGGPPAARAYAMSAYDSTGDRMFLFGGRTSGGTFFNDTWQLSWAESPTPVLTSLVDESVDGRSVHLAWSTPDGPGATATAERTADGAAWTALGTLVADAAGRLALDDVVPADGRWGYRLRVGARATPTETTWLDASAVAAMALLGATPNPAVGATRIAFALRGAPGASLAVLDVRGRVVLARDLSTLGPGAHVLALARGELGGAGMYFVRLTEADRTLTRKLVLLP